MRQAIFIAIGLALGIGLVITVTAASAGVKNAQTDVLHALYGVGTDITVTKAPAAGANSGSFGFGFRQSIGSKKSPAAGSTINNNTLSAGVALSSLPSSDVTKVASLTKVAAAAGGLSLTDRQISGKVPAVNSSGGQGSGFGGGGGGGGGAPSSFGANFNINSYSVTGVDLANGELGPLSSGTIASGTTFTAADGNSNVALLDSDYATQEKLKVGDTISIGNSSNTGTSFKIIGIVNDAGANPSDVYIPLERAQTLANLKNDVNTIYVAASNANNVNGVASEISKTVSGSTVTTSADLASEITGSLSTTASLANSLGKWLAILVLIAAFLLASLLTMSAVTRRIREFGTLKALGWKSRRIVFQVMGESIVVGIIGGVAGVGLGFLGARLVDKFSGSLSATVASSTTGSATPGGAQAFGGGGGGFPGGGGGFPGGTGAPGATGGTGAGASNRFGFARSAADAAHTVAVHLTAPVTVDAVVAAVVLAILGGLIAGTFGGWRAASLRPAAALSKVA
jgi:ABC-type lipoprotein release transport system permease subunit